MKSCIDPKSTLADIASSHPHLIPVMQRFQLDFCCGGGETLESACLRQGLTTSVVVSEFECTTPSAESVPLRNWTLSSMAELADHIETTHHAFVRASMKSLAALAEKVAMAHAKKHPELNELRVLIALLDADMMDHMIREERVLFPWLRRLERPTEITSSPPWSVKRPIDCMVHDHDDVANLLRQIRALTRDFTPPPDACSSYRNMLILLADLEADTHTHIHLENNILFPAGVRAEAERGQASNSAR